MSYINNTTENITLFETDDNKKAGKKFYNDNIDRLISQCSNQENNPFSYMAGFSFLEGYFRERFPKKFGFSLKNETHITFPKIAEIFIHYCQNMKKNTESVLILYDLKKMYGTWDNKSWTTFENTDTNHIRHAFSDLKDGQLSILIEKLIKFFKDQDINTEKLENLISSFELMDDKAKGEFFNYFSGSLETFYEKYDEFMEYLDYKDDLNMPLKNFLAENFPEQTNQIDFRSQFKKMSFDRKLKNYKDNIANLNNEEFIEKEVFLKALSYSLDQEITGRDYEKEERDSGFLNIDQKKIVDECYDKLFIQKEDIVIKGAPGTGKTLVLISALLNLNKSKGINPPLLTFSDSLEKYNEYLCSVYHKSLSQQLKITEYSENEFKQFINDHVKSFKTWLDDKLTKMGYNLYKIEKKDGKKGLVAKYPELEKYPEKLFEEAINDVWPNCKEPSKELIEIHNIFENSVEKPDLYVYWLFSQKKKEELDCYSNDKKEETLIIDEVQDLTKAQLQTARLIAKNGCIIAGDINQSIRHVFTKWEDLGIDSNTVIELTKNYRMSLNIQKLGNSYLSKCNAGSYSNDSKNIPGPKPQLFTSRKASDLFTQISSSIQLLVNRLNKKYKDIFVVVPTDKEVKSLKTKLTNRIKDIKIQILKVDKNENTTFDDENTINIGTIESIKGLDCPIVLLLLNDSIFIQRSPETISNAIYTVINRAMHLLQIFMPDELTENENPCIENLVYLLRNGDFKDEELPKYTYKFTPKDIIEIDGQKFLKGCYNNEQGKISEEVLLRRYNKDINYFLNNCDSLIVQDSYTNTEELYPLFYEKKTVSTKIYKK